MPPGATGKNSKGEWIKETAEGTYTWYTELSGWYISHILASRDNLNNGIPLVDQNVNEWRGVPFHFYVQDTLARVPYLRHSANPDEWGKGLSGGVMWGLYHSRFEDISRSAMGDMYLLGNLSVPFITPDGNQYEWRPSQRIGYEFYAIPWSEADPTTHTEYYETHTVKRFGDAVYRWTIYTKPDGTLIAKGAIQDPTPTDIEFLEWILNPMGTIIKYKQLPTKEQLTGWSFSIYPSEYVSRAIDFVSHPYFDIIYEP
jgi:hypothetical protein